MNEILAQIKQIILSQKQVAIISHINPDGDTLGSQLAMAHAVNQFGIQPVLLNCDEISDKYKFVLGQLQVNQYQPDMILPDVVIFVDCATLERAGFAQYEQQLQGRTVINIDHHTSNNFFGAINYVQAGAAANCQVIYEVISALGAELTPLLATALYLGISTDTGSFLFDSVSADTHRVAAVLIEAGANTDQIRANIYENCSQARFRLQKYIYNQTSLSDDGLLAWRTFDYEMLNQLKADSADIDGLVNSIKNIEGVEVALLFRGIETNKVKVSFRSKVWADVNAIASNFGGGGHVRASGCTIEGSMNECVKQVVDQTQAYLLRGKA